MLTFHLLATDNIVKQVLCTDLIGVIGHFMKSVSDSQLTHNNSLTVYKVFDLR